MLVQDGYALPFDLPLHDIPFSVWLTRGDHQIAAPTCGGGLRDDLPQRSNRVDDRTTGGIGHELGQRFDRAFAVGAGGQAQNERHLGWQARDGGLQDLQSVFDSVTAAQGRVGATLSALPAEKLRLDELRRASDTRRSQAEEISLAEAISEMTRAQQAQQAAIAAAGQNQKRSLMDYL